VHTYGKCVRVGIYEVPPKKTGGGGRRRREKKHAAEKPAD